MKVPTRIPGSDSFELTGAIFLRLLGLIYLITFASFYPQLPGLIGSHGIAPAFRWMDALRAQGWAGYFQAPSLFWFAISDRLLQRSCIVGCVAALVMISGRFARIAAAICWVLYLSIVSVGQPFSNFQWDALLLECGFLALFLGVPLTGYAYRFLLFRLMFESGAVKLLSHDPTWRHLTALRYHFLTQPLPNPFAYYAYRLPDWALDSMTFIALAIELAVPFLLWGPRRIRWIAVGAFMLLQVTILLTGNYAFFNLLTLALCFWGLDDRTFERMRRVLKSGLLTIGRQTLRKVVSTAVGILILLGAIELAGMFEPHVQSAFAPVFEWVESFEIVNTYGLFADMTTSRTELIVEGSNDGTNWREYQFRYKPGQLNRDLPIVAPYQPRLDWQMWFAALGSYEQSSWTGGLVYGLLTGSKTIEALMEAPPFDKPPTYIRIVAYDYQFTTPEVRDRTGAVWQRKLLGLWLNPVALKQ